MHNFILAVKLILAVKNSNCYKNSWAINTVLKPYASKHEQNTPHLSLKMPESIVVENEMGPDDL